MPKRNSLEYYKLWKCFFKPGWPCLPEYTAFVRLYVTLRRNWDKPHKIYVCVVGIEKHFFIRFNGPRTRNFAKFCKNKCRLFYKRQERRKKHGVVLAISRWLPFAKFHKSKSQLFLIHQRNLWKAQRHVGNFAMATISKILQKPISTTVETGYNDIQGTVIIGRYNRL